MKIDINAPHDPSNPDPWLALALDRSTFIDEQARIALARNNATLSRRVLLPVIRPLARLMLVLIRFVRLFIPRTMVSSSALHALICWGMRNFVSQDANYLILRHFNMGSQVLRFFNDNLADGKLPGHPLLPQTIDELRGNVFVQHDLNIYNFIIDLNQYLRTNNRHITSRQLGQIDFSAIRDFDIDRTKIPNRWSNVLDLQSAIEIYTPLFTVFLSRDDFERASNSLQLDETIAIYAATLFDRGEIMGIVNNKHPLVPLSTLGTGLRLMLHGLDAENLYGFIKFARDQQHRQAAA